MSVVIDGTSGITFPDASSQSVAAPTVSTAAGDVGTLVFASTGTVSTNLIFGSSYAGSTLYPAGAVRNGGSGSEYMVHVTAGDGSALSGTWRCLGNQNSGIRGRVTLFQRIS